MDDVRSMRAVKASLATLLGEMRDRGLKEMEVDTVESLYGCCTDGHGSLIEFCRILVSHT